MNELVQENIVDSEGDLEYHVWLGQNRPILKVASLTVAYQQLEHFADYDCVDNWRDYNMDTNENYHVYKMCYDDGCCGFLDVVFLIDNQKHMVGINYGH